MAINVVISYTPANDIFNAPAQEMGVISAAPIRPLRGIGAASDAYIYAPAGSTAPVYNREALSTDSDVEYVAAVAGIYTVTIGGTVASGDTITVGGAVTTLDATSGATTTAAATAVAAVINAASTGAAAKYAATSSGAVVTMTEKTGDEGTGAPTATTSTTDITVAVATTKAGVAGSVASTTLYSYGTASQRRWPTTVTDNIKSIIEAYKTPQVPVYRAWQSFKLAIDGSTPYTFEAASAAEADFYVNAGKALVNYGITVTSTTV
jgi:hypothetical protein